MGDKHQLYQHLANYVMPLNILSETRKNKDTIYNVPLFIKWNVGQYVRLCAIWYHLYKSKNVKNTHGWVPPFTNLLKVTLFHVCFHVFKIILNCTNGTKSLNRSHIDWKNHGSSASFCFIYLTNMNYDTNLLKSHSKIHFDFTCHSIFPPFFDKNFELMQWCSLSVNQKHLMQAMIKLT